MRTIGRPRCPLCGSRLRKGRPAGQLCNPCEQVGSDPRSKLPADFYDQEPIVAELAGYEFGPFFLTVRGLTTWSQQTLGGVIGLEQSQISAIERGDSHLRDIELIAGVAHGLQIPPARLNFPDIRVTVGAQGDAERKVVSWVDRRDFGQHIAGLVLGIAGAAGLDPDRLIALLPQAEPTGTRHIGTADVDFIEQATTTYMHQDFAHGGGLIREAAEAQLRTVLPLLNAQVAPELRPRLMIATARLAMQAGWISFECNHHEAARRLWMIALNVAQETDDPQATDLIAFLLSDMALQSVHLGRPDEALHLTRVGETAAVGRHPVSASTASLLADVKAQAHARQGDTAGCNRALGEAEEHFVVADLAVQPPYGAFLDETHLASFQGGAHYTLAMLNRDSRAAQKAVPLLRHAVDHLGPDYARPRAACLPDLAGAHALTRDMDTAVTVGHQAVDAISAVSSPRALDRLRTLHTVLKPFHHSPEVADLRNRLATTVA